ncbi:hypothetical protein [Leucobacter sp. wl10]|uniref:hypothetical protein n=1 Tax=Leucobacter sp. wl10 TaxID=2304677 RepID=UPI0013C3340A|nr:hypothetical protein [Leucobacter sp. wl10]
MSHPQSTRTFVAAFVGVLITRLVSEVEMIQNVVRWVDGVFAEAGYPGFSVLTVVESAVVGGVILAYQSIAQWLGNRWPSVERLLLGSGSRPRYVSRHGK